MTAPDRPLNKALWLVGPDSGPEWDLELEQTDGSRTLLMHIESEDATGVGYLLSHAAMSMRLPLLRDVGQSMPYPCCEHCGCGTPNGEWATRTGHDDTCSHGCNDEREPDYEQMADEHSGSHLTGDDDL